MIQKDVPRSAPLTVFPRRQVLRTGALAAGAIVSGAAVTSAGAKAPLGQLMAPMQISTPPSTPVGTPVAPASYQPLSLSADEYRVLSAAIDRIFPHDEYGPGANEAGVGIYIDRTLGDRNAALLPLFQQGLKALDGAASGGSFTELDASAQDALLSTAEAGKLSNDPGGFFAVLLEFSRQGMFGDPVHGGNIGYAGWDLINYPGIKLVWSAEDQAIGSVVQPAHTSVESFRG